MSAARDLAAAVMLRRWQQCDEQEHVDEAEGHLGCLLDAIEQAGLELRLVRPQALSHASRPTSEEVGYAIQHLWRLAHADPDTYRLLAHLLDLQAWLCDELAAAEQAAAYGPGTPDVHVLGGNGSGVEARLRDDLAQTLRRFRRDWRADLRGTGSRWSDMAANVAAMADPHGAEVG